MQDSAERTAMVAAARECATLRNAVALAGWMGTGRPVTGKGVLPRADARAAAGALHIEMPQAFRSAADVPALHQPWTAAVAAELVSIDGGRARPGSGLAGWQAATDDELLDAWARAFAAVLTDTYVDDGDGSEALEIGRLVLSVLTADRVATGARLSRAMSDTVLAADYRLFRIFDPGVGIPDPAEIALDLLEGLGAVAHTGGRRRITPLGRWALPVLETRGVSLLGSSEPEADGRCQLRITLQHVRPECWRRVLVPASATLGDLHEVIQIAFAWDGDHLHAFTIGQRQYGDPFHAEYDEDKITVATAFAHARKPISYVYDFGDSWQHEIRLEKTVGPDPAVSHPVCVAGRGDAPVEDCGEDEPTWILFDQADINTRLAPLSIGVRQIEGRLRHDIEIILTDAYGEAEELAAFATVLAEEIDFPVLATLLGEPVTVSAVLDDGAGVELRARCRGRNAKGLVSFADLEFRPGTVEAWLHAAYLGCLGVPGPTPTPPAEWKGLDHWRS